MPSTIEARANIPMVLSIEEQIEEQLIHISWIIAKSESLDTAEISTTIGIEEASNISGSQPKKGPAESLKSRAQSRAKIAAKRALNNEHEGIRASIDSRSISNKPQEPIEKASKS